MKKIFILALAVSTVMSCQKEDMDNEETNVSEEIVKVAVKAGESYKYQLPAGKEQPSISADAKHAILSKISIVPGSGESVYEYASTDNYSGSDKVSVNIVTDNSTQYNSGHCGGGTKSNSYGNSKNNGGGDKKADDKNIKKITFQFTVKCDKK